MDKLAVIHQAAVADGDARLLAEATQTLTNQVPWAAELTGPTAETSVGRSEVPASYFDRKNDASV